MATMQRRTLLKGGAGALATATIGGTALTALTGGAGAATSDNFAISDTSVTTTDGTIEFVDVSATHKVVWTGFDVPVAAVAWKDTLVKPADGTSHVLHDGTGSPVRIADFSTQGSGSDGWGGSGEYASENPDSYTAATGPTKEGFVHADIAWTVLGDGDGTHAAQSIESPASLDAFGIEQPTDGETKTTTLEYRKELHFYREDGSGGLVEMGSEDGTIAVAEGVATFDVSVTNEASSSSTSGDGSSTAG